MDTPTTVSTLPPPRFDAFPPPPPPPPPPAPHGPSKPPSRQRLARVARLTLMAAAIGLAFLIDSAIFTGVIVLFVLIVPFEKMYPRQKGQRIRRPLVGTDISYALLGPLLNVVGIVALVVIGGLSLFWLPGLALSPLVGLIPAAALPFVGFLMFDFVSYWTHRFAHEVPFMWRFHSVHHSPEHMDWVSGFRIHPFDGVVIAPAFFFLIGAGFDAELAGVFAVFQIILGLFFHANVRFRWRYLDKVAANPEFHHWHHSSEDDAVGHNYGAALPWWDLLFGTFFMPKHTTGRRPARYGVSPQLPNHLLGQLTYPCRGARRHLWLWRHPILAVRTLAAATRNLLVDIRRSAFRPTHSIRREASPGVFSTNSSLLGPDAVPKPAKKPLPARRRGEPAASITA
ncbi:MAG: sterol desaturase family protein [Ilumatobacter sp.]|uniref:sterol desaturase family protein n=1 Tax=Ilumatobacter sp. TaxID=1967498 RepID=UPI00262728AD|nr:sterol desaturase family protein [Ilumatobacter sp.]MDJ0769807.1 sterol desaturase family protein [Ilumatobacter sp.]